MAHRNDHHFNYYSSHSSFGGQETNHDNFQEFTDQALYESDEFHMYTYKIKKTHLCYAGMACERRVCFFAHTPKELRPETKYNWCYVYQYPLDIQPYPDILIENEPNGNWMVIRCNPQLPLPPNDQAGLENSSIPQQISQKNTSTFELFVSSHPSSSQSQPKTDQRVQNEDDFSFFSASHAKLAEELKNLEIGSTSHGKVNKIYDEKGKRLLEFESQNQEFSNINWVSDLLVDEFEDRRL
ncbi:hypothetical protein HAX54_017463 [Datura stramonium]|uniref:Uncharacterized protein n=1 Tax=Datura stramonium TaxID=4076 RepID=A0ABS8UM21_DATST|nr:hypothetical protein [Datura stramonium]